MGSGCKYGWSFVRLPAAHHLRYSLAPDGAMDRSMAQGLGDPRLRACGKHWPLAPLFLVIAGPVHSVDVSRLVLPLVLCVFEGDRGEWDVGWWPWGEAPSVTGHLAERVIQHRGPEWAALNLCPNPNLTFKYIYLYIKESACDAGDQGLIPGLGSSSGEGNGNALPYCCLENSMDRSLAGYSPWGRKELGMTEWLTHIHIFFLFTHLYIWLHRVLVAAYGSSSLTRDWTWVPLHWVCGVLATQPSGKSPNLVLSFPGQLHIVSQQQQVVNWKERLLVIPAGRVSPMHHPMSLWRKGHDLWRGSVELGEILDCVSEKDSSSARWHVVLQTRECPHNGSAGLFVSAWKARENWVKRLISALKPG